MIIIISPAITIIVYAIVAIIFRCCCRIAGVIILTCNTAPAITIGTNDTIIVRTSFPFVISSIIATEIGNGFIIRANSRTYILCATRGKIVRKIATFAFYTVIFCRTIIVDAFKRMNCATCIIIAFRTTGITCFLTIYCAARFTQFCTFARFFVTLIGTIIILPAIVSASIADIIFAFIASSCAFNRRRTSIASFALSRVRITPIGAKIV